VGAVGATSLRCGLRCLGEGDLLYLVAEKRRLSDIVFFFRVSSRGEGLRVEGKHGR
jgi:hypothetical protein